MKNNQDPTSQITRLGASKAGARFGAILVLIAALAACGPVGEPPTAQTRPNILFAISDDQSWLHTGAMGDPNVETPAFDRVASEGVLFTHAFAAAPSCTPSRGAILTGQSIWRIEEAGLLARDRS